MTRRFAALLGLASLVPAALGAQATPHAAPTPQHQPPSMEDFLFPPEMVMRHQRDLGLTAAQRATITDAIKAAESGMVEQQWQMQDEQQKLHDLLDKPAVDEAAVLAQVDRVLDLERAIKRLHLTMLVRVKNALTPEQQAKLKEFQQPHLELMREHSPPGETTGHFRQL